MCVCLGDGLLGGWVDMCLCGWLGVWVAVWMCV